ncbi:hypothetical protein GA0111570_10585 [Raineyella antarctica]|uniref:ATP synthase protein I n=1 Tax=Raineyella antarctica TaxID=1577474 RepID=A0A1G6GUM2_9ACTN|nr:hypothetical protein [Raineyella antarctica]SDB85634.1 hypothetical protein GA0111570_10585 [Raineyella antarctica]
MAVDEQPGVVDPTPAGPVPDRPATGAATAYARHLLFAGLLGGHLGLIGSVAVFAAVRGGVAAASAAVGSVVAILFFSLGQAVVLRYAERNGSGLLVAALGSYGVRIAGLAGALSLYEGAGLQILDRTATSLGVVATVLLWTTAEVVAFARMRMPVYDLGYTPRPPRSGK